MDDKIKAVILSKGEYHIEKNLFTDEQLKVFMDFAESRGIKLVLK